MAARAAAFLANVEAGGDADPLALAEAVDVHLGELVRMAAAVADAPEAFRTRRAIELAGALMEVFEEPAQAQALGEQRTV